MGVSDLTLLSKISNEAINDNLKKRFENAEIYVRQTRPIDRLQGEEADLRRQTYIGHVLVSVNPFRDCKPNGKQALKIFR